MKPRWLSATSDLINAANMLLFILSGPRTDSLPFVTEVAGAAPIQTDPLPHALILTAIVIGFAMVCFVSSLVKQVGMATGSDDFRSLIQESE